MTNYLKKSVLVLFDDISNDKMFPKSKESTGMLSSIANWCERIASGVIAMSIISVAAILFSQQFWGFFYDRFFTASSTEVINTIDLQEQVQNC